MIPATVTCPACRQPVTNTPFYCCKGQPANSVILCQSPEEATGLSTGDISLLHCPSCGFIFNAAYDPEICTYDQRYEETQTHSAVFNAFHYKLASHLIRTYRLSHKTILEIGCGKGDFLNLLCTMGDNRGIGYDPSYVAERSQGGLAANVTIYREFFPEHYSGPQPDCIICKMSLEHIADVSGFLGRVREAIDPGNKTIVFFQVPDTEQLLEESRFWDIYYEHCSYFTEESLRHLFQQSGFQVVSIAGQYDQQYLTIEARAAETPAAEHRRSGRISYTRDLVQSFSASIRGHIDKWQQLLRKFRADDRTVALWGGGSKAVSFLATLQQTEAVHWVVDINPHKQGMYLPGSGHRVIAPEKLIDVKVDCILVMNPMYMEEVRDQLAALQIECELFPVTNS